ncbi:MAG TPA: CBS domain-containing protein [Trichocoleus sp.]
MLTVADIMTASVSTISSAASVADAIAQMQRAKLRSLIVERRQEAMPYGIVTERDVVYKVIARGHDPARVIVQDIMRQPCIAVDPKLTLTQLAQLFCDTGIQRAPVMQEGRLLGVVSVTDIVMRGLSSETTV